MGRGLCLGRWGGTALERCGGSAPDGGGTAPRDEGVTAPGRWRGHWGALPGGVGGGTVLGRWECLPQKEGPLPWEVGGVLLQEVRGSLPWGGGGALTVNAQVGSSRQGGRADLAGAE